MCPPSIGPHSPASAQKPVLVTCAPSYSFDPSMSATTPTHRGQPWRAQRPSSEQQCSPIKRNDHRKLENYTNTHFSRSFNLLVLSDISNEAFLDRKAINKSPPFYLRKDLSFDTIEDISIEDSETTLLNDIHTELASTARLLRKASSRVSLQPPSSQQLRPNYSPSRPSRLNQSPSQQSQLGHSPSWRARSRLSLRTHTSSSPSKTRSSQTPSRPQPYTPSASQPFFPPSYTQQNYSPPRPALQFSSTSPSRRVLQLSNTFTHTRHSTASRPGLVDTCGDDIDRSSSSQSSIKRSSKLVNLLLQPARSPVRPAALGALPALSHPSHSQAGLFDSPDHGYDQVSPVAARVSSKDPMDGASAQNKFKRPHVLISQSPSPKIGKLLHPAKASLYRPSAKLNLSDGLSADSDTRIPPLDPLYSPSKLGVLGYKMFKNSSRDALISPQREWPKMPAKSPFKGHSIYNPPAHDEMEIDSPSRRSKNLPRTSFSVFRDDTAVERSSNSRVGAQSAPPLFSQNNFTFEEPRHDSALFDDKENKALYRFVKPLQAAFCSSGLLKKTRKPSDALRKPPPDTPIKKNPLMLINTNTDIKRPSVLHNHQDAAHAITLDTVFLVPKGGAFAPPFSRYEGYGAGPETPTKAVRKLRLSPARLVATRCRESNDQPMTPVNFAPSKQLPSQRCGLEMSPIACPDSTNDIILAVPSHDPISAHEGAFELERAASVQPSSIDEHLNLKFGMKNIKHIGDGEFSVAFECTFKGQKLAVKRTKRPVCGKRERQAILSEIEALRALTAVGNDDSAQEEGKEYLVYFIEAWEYNHHYYIMTEFCDNGTLYDFVEQNHTYKIDEFRIWKILIEVLSGLSFIHSKNYLHLDIKPANIFVTFEGSLKIGDFGLTTKLPIREKDFDLEGDRNYIAPELINDKIYTPFADIFSFGLVILELAANIILPDNGTPWRKLRSGDLSDAGRLSSDNISDFLLHRNFLSIESHALSMGLLDKPNSLAVPAPAMSPSRLRNLIPAWAPPFLVSGDSMCLDKVVGLMLRPAPFDRPSAATILEMPECVMIENCRKAGATIYEGEFGPGPDEYEV